MNTLLLGRHDRIPEHTSRSPTALCNAHTMAGPGLDAKALQSVQDVIAVLPAAVGQILQVESLMSTC